MLKNAYLLAKIGVDTAENEQQFADILTKFRDVTQHSLLVTGERRPPRRDGSAVPGRPRPRVLRRASGSGAAAGPKTSF